MHCPELTGKGTAPKDTACTVQHITDPEPQDIASTVQQSTGTGTAPHITPCDVQHMGTLLQALNYTACKSTIACTVHQSTSLHVCYCKANHYMKRNVQYSTILVHFCKTMHITASTLMHGKHRTRLEARFCIERSPLKTRHYTAKYSTIKTTQFTNRVHCNSVYH
jgi:hypothetical protein